MNSLRASHVWLRVDDLHRAVAELRDLGFAVEWGSDPKSARNAMIWFADGPFIEISAVPPFLARLRWLIAIRHGRATGDRIARWADPATGWRDLALETDDKDLTATRDRLRGAGIDVGRIVRGSRTRPDGDTVTYQFLAVRPDRLPFVVSSYVPPQRPSYVAHPNGATGVHAIHVGVAPVDAAAFDALADDRAGLVVHRATETGVLEVELDGLAESIPAERLQGAAITRRRR